MAFKTVATVLTVYGIETMKYKVILLTALLGVATVLTVYGIETSVVTSSTSQILTVLVATVLTVYGIETTHAMDTF